MDNEEVKKGKKTYDLKIIKWLFGFTGPYRIFMALALLFMLLTAALELTVPYIAKLAVDKYIYPSWRIAELTDKETDKKLVSEIKEKYPSLVLPLENGSFLIDMSEIDNTDRHNLEKLDLVSNERYLAINQDELVGEDYKKVSAIVAKNESMFNKAGGYDYISYSSLDNLSRQDLLVLRSGEIKQVVRLASILFLCLFGVFIFSSFFTYLLNYSGHKIMHRMRVDVFYHIMKLPQTFFDKNPVGRLTTRVTNDVNAINEMYTSVMVQFFKDVLVVIGVLVVMFYMNKELTVFVFILTLLMLIFASLFRMKLKTVYRDVRRSIAKLNAFVQESVRGIILIKLYNKEIENLEKFKGVNSENYKANMDQLWVYATFRPFIEFTSVFTVAFILWYGGIKVLSLDLTLGALIAYLYYVRLLFRPIMELAEKYNIFQSASVATENLYDLANAVPEESLGINDGEIRGELEFKNVWFSYDDKEWVLKDVSFKLEPGETVALVGLTGSGKTTVVNLILRFYEAQRGQILFDGVDIKNYSPDFLRENISAVFQDLFLFGKNITDGHHGNLNQLSGIKNINQLTQSDRNSISSGEKQIVSIGQAFSKRAKFMILDEATSHIDANIEKYIQETIKSNGNDVTTLIIAHRLSNVREADRILVIHKGEITESGTHFALLAKKGIYFNLYNLQNEIRRFSSLQN
ncbi:MAG: ABC transporter ATP-binding protein [Candidatus Dadabacteria bacterium]|nr:ABC transporter ATP-binding protein [Candidatus Dadabacteria bacterium]MCZ6639215.1 ABC transporter ATP-binding protein [Candidatus Dadabacteria bacterium]MCZ6684747.1 ABC transporter ATP-binding protein [Candidatus Dadabacteria bacterium]MCZ6790696.1 ABC transporter ATP-binding protein [Candidatus Dadabacteria bacterium]